jgi:L-ascorbate metabolism protein UlaG (beta-lactamase superfamily)
LTLVVPHVIFRLTQMEINWLGHSCFRIKGSQTTVITDPYSPDLGYSLGKQSAAIVTVSHRHPGHSFVSGIADNPRVIWGPGEYEVTNTLIIGLATFHDKEEGKQRGKNTVYVIELDELSVCHLGDLGHVLTAQQVEEIGNVDILLVPVGDVSTINATSAAEVVRQLEPRIVVPMHYKTPVLTKELEPVDRFLKEMGVKDSTSRPKLTITKNNLPASMQVVLLDY